MKSIILFLSLVFSVFASLAQNIDPNQKLKIYKICEELNMAYNAKDVEYLKNFYKDEAIVLETIVQGDSIRKLKGAENILRNLQRLWLRGEGCRFLTDEMEVRMSPKNASFFSATFKHEWRSKYYSDEGYMFLLIELSNEEKPIVHVCEWYHGYPLDKKKIPTLGDFDY